MAIWRSRKKLLTVLAYLHFNKIFNESKISKNINLMKKPGTASLLGIQSDPKSVASEGA